MKQATFGRSRPSWNNTRAAAAYSKRSPRRFEELAVADSKRLHSSPEYRLPRAETLVPMERTVAINEHPMSDCSGCKIPKYRVNVEAIHSF